MNKNRESDNPYGRKLEGTYPTHFYVTTQHASKIRIGIKILGREYVFLDTKTKQGTTALHVNVVSC